MADGPDRALSLARLMLVDRGLPGSPISEASNKEIERVMAQFPDIEIVGWYTSNYALGDEQAGVASLLAANPQIDGILTAGYGTGAIQALKDAGRPLVPIVAFLGACGATANTLALSPVPWPTGSFEALVPGTTRTAGFTS